MKATNRLLFAIAVLLALHLLKDSPALAGDKMVIASIDKPVRVQIVAVDRKVGAQWDALNCGGTKEWSNE